MKNSIKVVMLAIISMVASTVAYAQVTTASIAGRVSDKDGAVEGAPVIAVYTATGATYYSVTDQRGYFRINGVTPGGPYVVKVEMLGYRKVETQGVYAPLGETVTVNATLEDEALSLDAAVFIADATDSGMNIDRSGAGTSVSQKTMSSLPSVNRSMNDVMRLTPQASVTSNGLSVGGGNYRSSYVTVDGAAFNNAFGIGSNLPAGGSPISLDAIEQMSVSITPFDVRHSGFTGGAINAVTKSGTNEWHASVYNYFGGDQLVGDRVEEEKLALSKAISNTTGFTIGGPIIKNKLFFFVNGEYAIDTVPGSSKVAAEGTGRIGENFKPGSTTVRPTETFLNEVKDYLAEKYGYNPGRYQGYSLETPDWKIMARVDWLINQDHKFNVRFSHTHNYASSSPSSSVNPINPNPYNRNSFGRTSDYAMYFESNRYYQEQNFTSFAAELNSRLFGGKGENILRFTWSHQDEPRSFVGGNFPTVDILENFDGDGDGVIEDKYADRAVITSFGPDPFTYGNLRDVQTYVATDEFSYRLGRHNLVAGLQFEYDNTKNGFMQGGLGYYVFNSWESFKNNEKPVAFAITHSNRDDLAQVYPSFEYMQTSVYLQDEVSFSDYFKLTGGVRFEIPVFPTIENNENKAFLELAKGNNTLSGHSTADMPKARVNISPRLGFNWDVLKDRSLIVRGGTGIYTGRIPFVWIVSAAGNSNCLQAQFIDTDGTKENTPHFHATTSEILEELYGGTFKAQDLPAPTGATIMDKKLKMPTSWKSSLAVDANLPGGIKATLEGIVNKDLTSVTATRLGYVKDAAGLSLPGEPSARSKYIAETIADKAAPAPYYLQNVDVNGHYYSITAQLQKDFNFGLSLMAAYTHSGAKSVHEGYGDQVSSLYNGGNNGVNGSMEPELGYSAFVAPNRVIANVSYRTDKGTTFGLFYEGVNSMYVNGYAYSRHSYTFNKNMTGEGGANSLIYIPTDAELANMPFASEDNKAAFKKFIEEDSYLSKNRGEYSTRGGVVAPMVHRFNFKVSQDVNFNIAGKVTTLQLGLDINNIGNLINSNWGLAKSLNSEGILAYNGGKYTFTAPQITTYKGVANTWQMLLSARLFF